MTWTRGMQERAVEALIKTAESIYGDNWKARIVQDGSTGITFDTLKRWEDKSVCPEAGKMLPKLNALGELFERHAKAHIEIYDRIAKMPETDEARIQMLKEVGSLMYGVSWMSPFSRMLKHEYGIDASPSLLSKLASGEYKSARLSLIVEPLSLHVWRRVGEIDVANDEFHEVATCLFQQNPRYQGKYSFPVYPLVAMGGFSCWTAPDHEFRT